MLRGMPEYNGAAPLQRTPIGVPWWQPDDRRKEEEMIFEKNLAWLAAASEGICLLKNCMFKNN